MMKILLILFASAAIFHKNAAHPTKRHDELAQTVLGAIREVMEILREGANGADLIHGFDGIVVIIDGIVGDANANVSKAEVRSLLDELQAKLNVKNEKGDTLTRNLDKSLTVLNGLTDLLEANLDTSDKQELYVILMAIREIVAELVVNMEHLGEGVIYSFVPSDNSSGTKVVAAVRRVRRGFGEDGSQWLLRGGRPLNRTRRCWLWCTYNYG